MAGLLALTAVGCFDTVAYTPQPAKVADPQHTLEDLVNIAEAPPLKVEITDTYLKLVYNGGDQGLATTLLRYDSVKELRLVKGKGLASGRYGVQAIDATGSPTFQFTVKDLETAQKFADALAAAVARAPKKP
jgi:hypothetical protein